MIDHNVNHGTWLFFCQQIIAFKNPLSQIQHISSLLQELHQETMNCTTTLTSTQHCPLTLPLWGKAKSSTSDADWSEKERFSTVEAQNDRKAGHQLNNIFVVISTTIWIDCNRNWRAPWKAGVSTYVVAIFRVARNPLKFGMPILFVLKNVPVFFFKAEKYGPNYTKIHPPSPCVRLQTL